MSFFTIAGMVGVFLILFYLTFVVVVFFWSMLNLSNGGTIAERLTFLALAGLVTWFWFLYLSNLPLTLAISSNV